MDTLNRLLRRVDTDGRLYTVAGDGSIGSPVEGEPARAAALSSVVGLARSADGELYALRFDGGLWQIGLALDGYTDDEVLIPGGGGGEVFVFDEQGRHLRTLHGLTGTILQTFGYDDEGLLTTITDADGLVTTVERDESAGDATAIVGPFGQRTALGMDSDGYLESLTTPGGETSRFEYVLGLMTHYEDARFADEGYDEAEAKSYVYDGRGRLLEAFDQLTGSTALRRQGSTGQPDYEVRLRSALEIDRTYRNRKLRNGSMEKVQIAADGTETTTQRRGNAESVTTLPDGTVLRRMSRPDPRFGMLAGFEGGGTLERPSGTATDTGSSRLVTLADPSNPFSIQAVTMTSTIEGRMQSVGYDGTSRRFTTTSPEARSRSVEIDERGRVVSTLSPEVEPLLVEYLASGVVDRIVVGSLGRDAESARITDFAYDELNRLDTVTDPEGFTVGYDYDRSNRVTLATLPDANVVSFDYDANGNITSVTPPGRPAHTFMYTKRNQLEAMTLPAPNADGSEAIESRLYDADRRLTFVTRADGRTLDFDYEPGKERLESIETHLGFLSFAYRADGKLDSVTTGDAQTLSFTYDGPVIREMTWTGEVAGSVGRSYDSSLRLETLDVNDANPISYDYDNDSLLTSAGALAVTREADTGRVETTTLGDVVTTWTYTAFGEPDTVIVTYDGTTIYAEDFDYDKRGWITELTRTQGATTTSIYGYDSRGRLETVTVDNVLESTYGYDANSNRTDYDGPFGMVTGATYDDRDRLVEYDGTTYSYRESGELTEKRSGISIQRYDYDVFGNLREVLKPTGTLIEYEIDGVQRRIGRKVDGTLTHGWLYQDGLNPVAELDGAGNVVTRFVYATRPNVPDYMVRGSVTYRIVADHLGSPRLVVDVATGTVAQELRYDEFGRVTLDTSPGFQPFGFAGGLYDPATGLVRFGARDYDPEVGRWTAPDPIGFAGTDTNLYAYAWSEPVSSIDLDGLSATNAISELLEGAAPYLPNIPQSATDICAGLGDALLLGFGDELRDLVTPGTSVDVESEAYIHGEIAGTVAGVAAGAGGVAKTLPGIFAKGSWLNSGRYIRIGFGRHGGNRVFRVAGEWVKNGKIDLWKGGPL